MDSVEKKLKSYVDNSEVSGAAVIVRKDSQVISKGMFGYADLISLKKVTPEYDFSAGIDDKTDYCRQYNAIC